MELVTKRLLLRTLLRADISVVHALHAMPETDEFNTLGIPASIDITQKLVEQWLSAELEEPRSAYIFYIEMTGTKEFIGLISLNMGKQHYRTAEVWYKIHPQHWKKNYATEALKALLLFGFDTLHLHRIEAGCAAENIASGKVLEKCGFIREGTRRKKLPVRGEWKDNYIYAILEEEWSK